MLVAEIRRIVMMSTGTGIDLIDNKPSTNNQMIDNESLNTALHDEARMHKHSSREDRKAHDHKLRNNPDTEEGSLASLKHLNIGMDLQRRWARWWRSRPAWSRTRQSGWSRCWNPERAEGRRSTLRTSRGTRRIGVCSRCRSRAGLWYRGLGPSRLPGRVGARLAFFVILFVIAYRELLYYVM